jgi:(p)ppGpp synthase/HD superfamily hydrolase
MMNPKLALAIKIATEAHLGQFRFDGVTPYITHPLRVAESFSEEKVGLREISWMHDLDDTKVTAQNLLKQGVSPWVVAALVALWRREGEEYRDYIKRVKLNDAARQVKIMDILDNLGDTPEPTMIKRYVEALKFLLS